MAKKRQFGETLTVRLPGDLLVWLKASSRLTGTPVSRLIREHLETAHAREGKQRFMRHLAAISGLPRDLSPARGSHALDTHLSGAQTRGDSAPLPAPGELICRMRYLSPTV